MGFEEDVLALLNKISGQTDRIQELENTLLEYQHNTERLTRDLGFANQKVTALTQELSKALNKSKQDTLNRKVNKLEKEIEKKDSMLNKNSLNSSKPSSSNPFKKVFNTRKKSNTPIGGQIGHTGYTLDKKEPDEIVDYYLENCPECRSLLSASNGYTAKQIVDVEVVTKVVEHRYHYYECSACYTTVNSTGE